MISQIGGSVEERIAEERESSNAQIRTMFDEQRRTVIAECSEKVLQHELLAAQAEQDRRILQEELLRQQQDFREVHQQDLIKMKELQKLQISTFRSSLRIWKLLLWNYLEEFKNYRMKWIASIIPRIFGMLSRLAVEIHTLPAHLDYSVDIFHLKDYWSQLSYCSDKLRSRLISGIHPVYQETFLHIHRLLHQLRTLGNWILFWRRTIEEPIHMSTGEK